MLIADSLAGRSAKVNISFPPPFGMSDAEADPVSGPAGIAPCRLSETHHDDHMLIASLVIIGTICGFTFIASAVAAVCHRLFKNNVLSVTIGTSTPAAVMCGLFVYWAGTMEVDDAPPGEVLIGNLIAVAMITPIALLGSFLTIRFLSRRDLQNGS